MFENDYIMRMIHEMVRALLKVIFHKDPEKEAEITFEDSEMGELYRELDGMVRQMKLVQAEDMLDSRLDEEKLESLEVALLFYDKLNRLDDESLEAQGLTREDLEERLKAIMDRFGYGDFTDLML